MNMVQEDYCMLCEAVFVNIVINRCIWDLGTQQ